MLDQTKITIRIGLHLVVNGLVWAITTINITDYGAKANNSSDITPAIRAAIETCRKLDAARIIFPKGRYDFWPDMANERYYFISNNDEGLKRIAFLLNGFDNLEIDGQGSLFIFHGYVNPFILDQSKNITLKNFSIDFERTFHSEAEILENHERGLDVKILEQFPYEIQNGILVFTDGGTGIERTTTTSRKVYFPYGSLLEYDFQKRETAFMANDYWVPSGLSVEPLGDRKVRLLLPTLKGTPGNVLVFGPLYRQIPGITISDCNGVTLDSVTIYHCGGMGVIAQRSGNILLDRVTVTPPPDSKRMISVTADATHFVNCFGKIEMRYCLFENQIDDPSNIHGIYAKIIRQPKEDEIIVQLVHPQQFGFDLVKSGEHLELVHGPSLMTYGAAQVKSVEYFNKEFIRIQFTQTLPNDLKPGDAVASLGNYPELYIQHCIMRGNRARGFLLNNRGKTIVEYNYFHVPGSAILFEGDARFWFEQAGVRDCVIRNNVFDNCNYGVWGEATIEVAAGITEEYRDKSRYNRNIVIEKNLFYVFDHHPIVKAYSIDGLIIRNNTIEHTNAYSSRNLNSNPFVITDSDNITISDNVSIENSIIKSLSDNPRVRAVMAERQPVADLGNGYYQNPILAGNYADVSVVRVGLDYYMVHCCGQSRDMLAWHSRDLVNWQPYTRINVPIVGSIWAPELIYYEGLFYLYLPMMSPGNGHVWVMTANSLKGPWSKPIDMGIQGIDPGHIADEHGNRYLYVDAGRVALLTHNGLGKDGELLNVYEGWQYPKDWTVECFCLESPKLIHHGDYYYMISAQGGTDGPSTSHMAVVARSPSPLGPWKNSPYNPLIRTRSRSERWWSQGHGVLIDDVEGNWWMLYHAIENNYRSLGRQTLLMPIEWLADGWPQVKDNAPSSERLSKPRGENVGHGMPLSDSFKNKELGLQWAYLKVGNPTESFQPGSGQLCFHADGTDVEDAPILFVQPTNHAYMAQVEIEIPDSSHAGLILFGDSAIITGSILKKGQIEMYVRGSTQRKVDWKENRALFKIVNDHHDVSVFYSKDGHEWDRFDFGLQLDGERNIRIGLFAAGKGTVFFRDFRYQGT